MQTQTRKAAMLYPLRNKLRQGIIIGLINYFFFSKYTTWCLNHSLKHAYRPRKIKYVKFTCRSKITILKYKQNTIFHLPWLVKVYIIISEEVHVRHRHQAKCPRIFFFIYFFTECAQK